jgi:hypothetical protein
LLSEARHEFPQPPAFVADGVCDGRVSHVERIVTRP